MAGKRPEHRDPEVLERGEIFFLYRPKLDVNDPESLDDVQRFHVVLRERGGHLFRLLTIGRKRLPEAEAHEREWGFVELVADKPEPIARALRERTYETKTRGTRTIKAARPAGEGAYALLRGGSGAGSGQHSLLMVYELALPERPGPVQDELRIAPAASYAVAVKNPEASSPPGVGLREGEEAHYPRALEREFHGRRFGGEDRHLLDFEGAEFVLVGVGERPGNVRASTPGNGHAPPDAAALLRRLKLSARDAPIRPLIEGEWA